MGIKKELKALLSFYSKIAKWVLKEVKKTPARSRALGAKTYGFLVLCIDNFATVAVASTLVATLGLSLTALLVGFKFLGFIAIAPAVTVLGIGLYFSALKWAPFVAIEDKAD